jgi:hypothetical protein
LDNLKIILGGMEGTNEKLNKEYIEYYKYDHIHRFFVDTEIEKLKDVKHVKHSWYYRDDLPKINLFTEQVTEYAENKLKNIGNKFIGVHYRPFSSDNELNIENDLNHFKPYIHQIIEDNKDTKIFFSTNKNMVKNYLKESNFKNIYLNDFIFPDVHDGIRELKLNDDDLFLILKETICDMYFFSKCEKIYRITNWFSAFMSFACLFNQTNVSNRERFIPEHPISPI